MTVPVYLAPRRRLLRNCAVCGTPSISARCPRHQQQVNRRTAHWEAVRAARLRLANYRCEFGYAGCTKLATTVHLDPALNRDHGGATLERTRAACLHCHGIEDAPRAHGAPAHSVTLEEHKAVRQT